MEAGMEGANICVGVGVERYKSWPESGKKLLRGFSAYILASNACPARGMADWGKGRGLPAATWKLSVGMKSNTAMGRLYLKLPFHKIETCDHLSHRMFNLQTCIPRQAINMPMWSNLYGDHTFP